MARWANLTKTSAGGEGTKAAAPDRFEDNGRARGLFEIRFAQVRRLRRPPDGRRASRRAKASLSFARVLVTPLRGERARAEPAHSFGVGAWRLFPSVRVRALKR